MVEPSAGRAPHPALRRLVEDYHGYRYAGGEPALHRGLPGADLTVVFAFDEPIDVAWLHEDGSRDRHWAMIAGLRAAPAAIRHAGFQHGIQWGLTPEGTRALLGVPAGSMSGLLLPLVDVLGPRADQMYDEVARQPTWATRFAELDRQLLSAVHHHRSGGVAITGPAKAELRCAWDRLAGGDGSLRVGDLAQQVGWSRRHLTGQFNAEFGIGPKELARIVRFQRVRSHLARPKCDLASVAAETGFADQAHLTREWRDLAGCTPSHWRRTELPFLQDETHLEKAESES